ncbi:MAG: NrfD/PsrC family molybdoenzyme membrane anchor subunit [Fervidicoccaceae archaeon]
MKRIFAVTLSLIALIVGLVLGIVGFGRKEVGEIAWGFLVPGYMFFAMTAAGAALVTLAPSLFGYEGRDGELRSLRKLALWFAAGTLIPSWFLILLDLSNPGGFIYIFSGFYPDSRIAWMAALYLTTFVVLVAELIYAIVKESKEAEGVPKKAMGAIILTMIGTVVELMLVSNLSQVFGVIQTFPAWHGSYMVAIFISTSLILGAAGMGLFGSLVMKGREKETRFITSYYGKMLIVASLALAFLLFWAFLSAYFDPMAWISFKKMLDGSYSIAFWSAAFIGLVISPILAGIALSRKSAASLMASSALSLIFGLTLLYLLIIVPQTTFFEVIPGVVRESTYAIGTAEILIALGGAFIWGALIALGFILLPLLPEERARKLFIFK